MVLQLTAGLAGRTITADNFFTSHELAVELKQRHQLFVGTVRKNKTFLPPKVLRMTRKPVYSSEFVFDNTNKFTLVSYVPNKNRFVLLLSSAHLNKNVAEDQAKKPQIILDYNKHKGGVDMADRMVNNYTCRRITRRWPMAVFYHMLDTSALNAFVIWRAINPDWEKDYQHKRQSFLKELAAQLTKPLIMRRTHTPRGESAARFVRIVRHGPIDEPTPGTSDEMQQPAPKRRKLEKSQRCKYCKPTGKESKYSNYCTICDAALCPEHTAPLVCLHCGGIAPTD